jgi:hypothetical protein
MAEEYKRPGWYPAPGEQGERWWNGASWSDSRRGQPASAPAPLPPVPSVVYSADKPAPQRPDPYATPVPTTFGRAAATVDARNNRLATVALALGAVGLFGLSIVSPVAVVLSLLGIAKARQLKAQGGSGSSIVLATIGLVMGVIGTIVFVTAAIAFIAAITVDFEP